MDELDSSPTTEELDKAIDNLACGKAPGSDGIPAEVLKSGKPTLLENLHELLCPGKKATSLRTCATPT